MKLVFYARPQPDLLPQEKEKLLAVSGFTVDRPANPVARFSKQPANGGDHWFSQHRFAGVLAQAGRD
jgi:hypothetical protein